MAVADVQTAGRGRLGRTWESPPGAGANLLCSVLLRPDLAGGDVPFLAVARVALAGRAAASAATGGRVVPGLKWPNDLVVEGVGKLAGVLAEVEGDAVVVGVGMNLGWAPPGAALLADVGEPAGMAGSADRGGVHTAGRDAVLDLLLRSLDEWLAADDRTVMRAYREACVTLGRPVRVDLVDGESFIGTAADVADSGALLVETAACLREVSAGDVIHLR